MFEFQNVADESIAFNLTVWAWKPVYLLAERYGWKPEGTLEPAVWVGRHWKGWYMTNDGQIVTDSDAHALADALEMALPDIPDTRVIPDEIAYTQQTREEVEPIALHRYGLLRKKIAFLEDYDPMSDETPDVLIVADGKEWQPSPVDMYSGAEAKQTIVDFIGFCRHGAFYIK
ncbi:MAG: hypothetical protein OHK0046_47910 [Anaerolineae bacterium]